MKEIHVFVVENLGKAENVPLKKSIIPLPTDKQHIHSHLGCFLVPLCACGRPGPLGD